MNSIDLNIVHFQVILSPFRGLTCIVKYYLTPTATSYTISTSLTGYTSPQKINPSELNLWRIIRKNSDGTVDVVSEYVSNTEVYFTGQTGFLNYVGALNTIAAQYTNSKYVSKTRHVGYSNQIEICSSLSECPVEYGSEDLNLIVTSTGSSLGQDSTGTAKSYWVASRNPYSNLQTNYYSVETVDTTGTILRRSLYAKGPYVIGDGNSNIQNSIRPILTFKDSVSIKSGSGTSAYPYQLS